MRVLVFCSMFIFSCVCARAQEFTTEYFLTYFQSELEGYDRMKEGRTLFEDAYLIIPENYIDFSAAAEQRFHDAVKQGIAEYKKDTKAPRDAYRAISHAITMGLGALDPHSLWISESDNKKMSFGISGRVEGLGFAVDMESDENFPVVALVSDNSPAQKADIRVGDKVLEVASIAINADNKQDVVRIVDEQGSKEFNIKILSAESNTVRDIPIKRASISVVNAKSAMLEDKYLHIILSGFGNKSFYQVVDALDTFAGKYEGIIIDLRGNGGGLLHQAVGIIDLFLDSGKIAGSGVKDPETGETSVGYYIARKGNEKVSPDIPVVVLVDGDSASASELTAASLQQNNRAVIMGRTTYGKGSVQLVLGLSDGSVIVLTTELYYTPNGGSVQNTGVMPDVYVKEKNPKKTTPPEKEYPNSIKNPSPEKSIRVNSVTVDGSRCAASKEDVILACAVAYLEASDLNKFIGLVNEGRK